MVAAKQKLSKPRSRLPVFDVRDLGAEFEMATV